MIEIRRILCPVDFSDHSRRALDHAIAIARWYESTVTVLHVFSPAPVASFGPDRAFLGPIVLTPVDRECLRAQLEDLAAAERADGVATETLVREGEAAGQILQEAASMRAHLVVLGSHGRTGFERLLLGSVAERVLRKAECPVLTVPQRLPDAVPARPVLYTRILCPVDFSDSSLHALEYAMSMAQEADGHLIVLHVLAHEFEPTAETSVVAYDLGMTIGDYLREREATLQRRLEEVTAGASDFCRVELLTTHGKPWREVLRVAAEKHSELIVMGVQGRGPADLMVFGSTTQHVVREAPCPVLTLRHA